MAKAKTANESKPVKKTVKKTFHKQPATTAEAITPVVPEPTPQADQVETPPEIETGTQPKPNPEPEPESAPEDPETQTATENITPIASTINPPQDDEESSTIADDSTTTTDAESTTTDKNDSDSESESAPEEPQNQTPPTESLLADPNDGGVKKPLIIALIIVILATTSITLYYLYAKKVKIANDKPQATPTSESQPQASPQTLNRADWTLEVLNGSGKTGAAAALAEKLTAKGYQVIKTGNAPEDAATSQVFFADSTKGQAELFLEDIKVEIPNPTNAGSLQDSTASARIVIGTE